MTTSQDLDSRPRAMAVFAHPDDAEFLCSGTIARLIAAGYRAQYVLATSGDKGSDDPMRRPSSSSPPGGQNSRQPQRCWASKR